jgi:hypothetical protein
LSFLHWLLFRPENIIDKIKDHLLLFPTLGPHYVPDWDGMIADIQKVLDPNDRGYLKVFDLERDTNLTATIFQAVVDAAHNRNIYMSKAQDPLPLLELAVNWNCVDEAHQIFERRKVTSLNLLILYRFCNEHLLLGLSNLFSKTVQTSIEETTGSICRLFFTSIL